MSAPPGGAVPPSNWVAAQHGAQAAQAPGGVVLCGRPTISVNWQHHDFGRVRQGTTPPPHPLVITSTGQLPLVLASVQGNSGEYRVDPPGATTLPVGATTSVGVHFAPTGFGVQNAQVRIDSNASNQGAITVTVTGKLYTVLTMVFQDEPGGAKRAGVTLKAQQAGQPEQEGTSGVAGRIEIETEVDGSFDFVSASHDQVLEFHALESA